MNERSNGAAAPCRPGSWHSPLVFIWHYFYECLAFGYHDAPLEREAVELSERPS